jgi:hypothetical protein
MTVQIALLRGINVALPGRIHPDVERGVVNARGASRANERSAGADEIDDLRRYLWCRISHRSLDEFGLEAEGG